MHAGSWPFCSVTVVCSTVCSTSMSFIVFISTFSNTSSSRSKSARLMESACFLSFDFVSGFTSVGVSIPLSDCDVAAAEDTGVNCGIEFCAAAFIFRFRDGWLFVTTVVPHVVVAGSSFSPSECVACTHDALAHNLAFLACNRASLSAAMSSFCFRSFSDQETTCSSSEKSYWEKINQIKFIYTPYYLSDDSGCLQLTVKINKV